MPLCDELFVPIVPYDIGYPYRYNCPLRDESYWATQEEKVEKNEFLKIENILIVDAGRVTDHKFNPKLI